MNGATPRRHSRRAFLALAGSAAAGGLLAACGVTGEDEPSAAGPAPSSIGLSAPPPAASAAATATPRPAPPAGREQRALLPGTPWEAPVYLAHSGIEGPRVLVLGGVHGNEPGGWLAAERIASWEVDRGSLIVVPRANRLATEVLERTLPELGDLNRLYPGGPAGPLPMERMAAAIIDLANEFQADLLLDLHESWAFYAERTMRGTAFIGQTITAASGPLADTLAFDLAAAVNAGITIERDRLIARNRNFRSADDANLPVQENIPGAGSERRGSSSLSLGEFVPGMTPVLVEMGQQHQPEARRSELHQQVVHAALSLYGVQTTVS